MNRAFYVRFFVAFFVFATTYVFVMADMSVADCAAPNAIPSLSMSKPLPLEFCSADANGKMRLDPYKTLAPTAMQPMMTSTIAQKMPAPNSLVGAAMPLDLPQVLR